MNEENIEIVDNEPTYISVIELAERLECTTQNVYKLLKKDIYKDFVIKSPISGKTMIDLKIIETIENNKKEESSLLVDNLQNKEQPNFYQLAKILQLQNDKSIDVIISEKDKEIERLMKIIESKDKQIIDLLNKLESEKNSHIEDLKIKKKKKN